MSSGIIFVHLVSASAAEIQALKSAGGIMATERTLYLRRFASARRKDNNRKRIVCNQRSIACRRH